MSSSEIEGVKSRLEQQGYIADPAIVMSLYLAETLQRPLLVEGPAGVGKTEIAKVMARSLEADLIRLQCYEGLDAHTALYEWNYQHQLLQIKLEERAHKPIQETEKSIFSEAFLLKRPLLQAITHPQKAVLLIDELDRADEEFESFLLELLSDWQITIPELGTIRAQHVPYVVITGNRTRELSDAIRRRCFYLWIEYPEYSKELKIVRSKVPEIDETLATQLCRFMEKLREEQLRKTPGIAESLDWAKALAVLHKDHLDSQIITQTLGIILKDPTDIQYVSQSVHELMESVGVYQKPLPEDFQSAQTP